MQSLLNVSASDTENAVAPSAQAAAAANTNGVPDAELRARARHIETKANYLSARAATYVRDYERARDFIRKALALDPRNEDIINAAFDLERYVFVSVFVSVRIRALRTRNVGFCLHERVLVCKLHVTRAMKRYVYVWAPFCRRALRGIADAGSCENRPSGQCDREPLDEADVLAFKERVRVKLRSFAADELLPEGAKAAGVGLREPSNEAPSPPQVLRVPLEKLDTVLHTAFIDVLGEQPFDALLQHSQVRFQCLLVHASMGWLLA